MTRGRVDGPRRRELLARARLYLIFTPSVCGERPALDVLESALPWIDAVQIRPKPVPAEEPQQVTCAREAADWTARVLELVGEREVLVLVNDRPDVARTLADSGCDGVHLGQEDAPPAEVRALLGPELLVGLSTHDAAQVVLAGEEPIDYLGFGPVFPTETRGYRRGQGPEAAWVAAEASPLPVFPIGGIGLATVDQLDRVGRAAVSSAVLAAADPARAACALKDVLAAGVT